MYRATWVYSGHHHRHLEKLGVLQANMSSKYVVICDTWENDPGPAMDGSNSIRAHLSVHTGAPLPSSSVVFKCAISPCFATCIALHLQLCYYALYCSLNCTAQPMNCTVHNLPALNSTWVVPVVLYASTAEHCTVIKVYSQHHCQNERWRSCWRFPWDAPSLREIHHLSEFSGFKELNCHRWEDRCSPEETSPPAALNCVWPCEVQYTVMLNILSLFLTKLR